MILFGSSLFLLYALPRPALASPMALRWPKPLILASAITLAIASVLGLVFQTSIMAGSLSEGLKPATLGFVAGGTGLGRASVVRALAALLAAMALMTLRSSKGLWLLLTMLGAISCGSLAWLGHGAASEGAPGYVHLLADVGHSLAAGAWVGALVGFLFLLSAEERSVEDDRVLYSALHGFSGIGAGLVAIIVATGLVNGWFLVGPTRVTEILTTPYGRLLSVKLVLFGGMLLLAASNRLRLTPALGQAIEAGRQPAKETLALRRSVTVESLAALTVLALVAWLGALAPSTAAA